MPIVCYRDGSDEIVGVNWTLVNTKEDNFFADLAKNVSSKCLTFEKELNFQEIIFVVVTQYVLYRVRVP